MYANHIINKLGSPVVPFSPFCYGVSLLKPNSSKKGTFIIKGLLGNLVRLIVQRMPMILLLKGRYRVTGGLGFKGSRV